jgi:hypothetical protein
MKEYLDLKEKLGDKMPYNGISSFRRASRAKTPQYQYLHYERRDTKQYNEWAEVLDKNMPFTLDEFRKIKYNDIDRFYRLESYKDAQKEDAISVFVNFNQYEETGKQIDKELVGLTTKDGIEVGGFVNHFIDRTIGQIAAGTKGKFKRTGVPIEDAKDCILNGEPGKETINSDGDRSIVYKGEKCVVSINPDTRKLIQCNPV